LWLALKALNLQSGECVLTTPFSFIASSSEIFAHGAHPVFIDIDENTYNLSPQVLHEWLEKNTVRDGAVTKHKSTGLKITGILVVNIFGLCANFTAIRALAKEYNLWIIEDAAQSVGAAHNNIPSGKLGDISCFSFYPTKNLGAAGDAGIVTTHSAELAKKLLTLKSHGRPNVAHYAYDGYGLNSRLDALQAVILDEKLHHLPAWLMRRQEIGRRYTKALSLMPGITTPYDDGTHTYHQYAIRISSSKAGFTRDELAAHLTQNGIGNRVFYPQSLHEIPYLQTHRDLYTQCIVSKKLCSEILALPVWPEMTNDEVDLVISSIESYAHQHNKRAIHQHEARL